MEALDLAVAAAAEAPDAFAAAAAAIAAGVGAELQALGAKGLAGLGGRDIGLFQQTDQTIQQISFLINHLAQLGLTAEMVAKSVQQNVFLELLSFAEAAAQALPEGTADQRLAKAQEIDRLATMRLEFERQGQLLRLKLIEVELRAAGALDNAMRQLIASGREFLSTVSSSTSAVDNLAGGGGAGPMTPAQRAKAAGAAIRRRKAAAASGSAGGSAGTLLSDIIHDFAEGAMTPLERLADQWQHSMDRIAEASGTALERETARMAATADFERQRTELQERQLDGLRSLLVAAEAQTLAGQSPVARVIAVRDRLRAAAASLDINDEASRERFLTAERAFRDLQAANVGSFADTRFANLNTLIQSTLTGALGSDGLPGIASAGSAAVPGGAFAPSSFAAPQPAATPRITVAQDPAMLQELKSIRADLVTLRGQLNRWEFSGRAARTTLENLGTELFR
jgi:hypothetical protein